MRIAVVPGALALLPEYAGLADPVAELRAAARAAVVWLGEGPVRVVVDAPDEIDAARGVTEPAGLRIARALGAEPGESDERLLVVANGSACRGEKAPGHLDERSFAFDETIEQALAGGDAEALGELDPALAQELLTAGTEGLRGLAAHPPREAALDYADDPYGVRYWVARWER